MLTWQDRLESLAARIGEPDLFHPAINAEQLTPYFDPITTEKWLYRACLFYLRSSQYSDLDSIGSKAILKLTGSTGAGILTSVVVPQNVLKIYNATIDVGTGYKPAEFIPQPYYLQMLTCSITESLTYSFINGYVAMHGTANFSITLLVEPTLADFQDDNVILPPGYDEDVIDRTKTYLMISDNLPQGRL